MDLEKFIQNSKTSYLAESYKKLEQDEAKTKEMILSDISLADLAYKELEEIRLQKEILQKQMEKILKEEEKESLGGLGINEIILEVRAGAGGEEASIFATELAEMYSKYALNKGWSVHKINESLSAVGGYKEASFEIRGKDIYKNLRFETGVHRIQ